VVFGDPSKSGFYTIVLSVPAHTTIQAHTHRDDRMAVVVSGTWHFGYGDRFDERALKSLPPGSVYSEPGGVTHLPRPPLTPYWWKYPASDRPIRAISTPQTLRRHRALSESVVRLRESSANRPRLLLRRIHLNCAPL
jgi:hypothetical protein